MQRSRRLLPPRSVSVLVCKVYTVPVAPTVRGHNTRTPKLDRSELEHTKAIEYHGNHTRTADRVAGGKVSRTVGGSAQNHRGARSAVISMSQRTTEFLILLL